MYINQNNLYYGCYYPIEIAPIIMSILRPSKYGAVETEDLVLGGSAIIANVNSDIDTQVKFGFIIAEEMTISGDDSVSPYGAIIQIKPQILVKQEELFNSAIEHISALHRLLIAGLCERGISIQKIYRGWFTILCTFEQ